MTRKFIVKRYFCEPEVMEKDMNEHYEKDYYPKEIKLDDHQGLVDATIIYELKESK